MSLPSLAGAEWLRAPAVREIFALLDRDGEEARIAGGAVRNALMGLAITDIDFATTATPDVVEQRAAAGGV
jgi:poly(A) polymerase